LYEKIEGGKCEVFEYKNVLGTVRHMFIKREIRTRIDSRVYYDLVTPYGYGGPLIINCVEGKQKELVQSFMSAFQDYCEENNVISEFVRFHPIFKNARYFGDYYNAEHVRNTIGTNLKDYSDPVLCEFSKSCRRNIRDALKRGITFEIIENPESLYDFKEIYYSTMQRNNAVEYYYFDDEYFENCVKLLGRNIVLVKAIYQNTTIAMGLYFQYNKLIHIHLSGTLSAFLHLSPAYVLRYAITLWGKEHGYELIHHGGGRTDSCDDSLYLFKKQFGKNTELEFWVGKKIWNDEAYSVLCDAVGVDHDTSYFPAYRATTR
jgi:hypothetical protein